MYGGSTGELSPPARMAGGLVSDSYRSSPKLFGDKGDADAARAVVEITEYAFRERPIRDTSGTNLAPSGVDVIAHASSRKIAFGAVRSTPFISLRANWETR